MEPISYIILAIYFGLLIGIGIWFSRGQENVSDFFLGGRNIPAWAALAAIVATETSAVTFIGAPAMAFREGGDLSFLQVAFGFVLARFVLSFYFLPRFFEHDIITIYAFLGRRFGTLTQKAAGILFFITRALAAGVRHYAAALVISAVTGMNLILAIVLTGGVSLVYSILGGISAIIWTEVVQLGVMILGGVLGIYYLLQMIPGGLEQAIVDATEAGKLALIHLDWSSGWNASSAYPLLTGVLGGFCLSLATHGADQDTVQRLLACKSLRSAKGAMIGSGFFIFFQFAFFLFLGILLFLHYGTLPEGLEKNDEIFPYFASREMGAIPAGLVIAAILSAALSSTASALNSLASTTMNDFVLPSLKTSISDRKAVLISRGFTLGWTVVLMLVAIGASQSGSIMDTGLGIPSLTYGSLLAAFLIGIFTRYRNQKGLVFGMIVGVVFVVMLKLWGLHWTWFVPAGVFSTTVVAWLFRELTTDKVEVSN